MQVDMMKKITRVHICIFLISGCIAFGALFMGISCALVQQQLFPLFLDDITNTGNPSVLLDDMGREWARFEIDFRQPVPLSHIPPAVIDAFLTAEDRTFFHHCGLSFRGIARSIAVNLYHGKRLQGASTITQQLVKLLFLHGKKTFSRKVQEQGYALLLEWYYTKEQILQTYLNRVYFGCGIYGVEAASQRFWAKSVTDLTLDQAATLAGIVRSPNNYCPLMYPLSAKKRRD
ncbi:MAG TPA: biosynthetic peptidoglycan transglycosylase, partial [Candidatus Bathyarchaeia archaeon]|nr:biosynthetic peptidoglycan transglycosylase [Candidatus Bathyarchaeia archaeon]